MSYEDNKKRMLQQDDIGAALSSKRAALGVTSHVDHSNGSAPSEENLYFKLLCPQSMTGIIIGKGGSNMTQLNAMTSAKIKLSQNGEFFPTTNDRILMLNGDRVGLQHVLRELVTRIAEAAEKKGEPYDRRQGAAANRGPDGSFQIRLLIPRASAGVLIGKGGAIIKQMIDQSHCRMQMGEEADPYNTNERILILNANSTHELANGAIEVMTMLHSQPKFRVYSNPTPSYSDAGAVPGGAVPPAAAPGAYQPSGGRPVASQPPMHHPGQGTVGPTVVTNMVPGVPGGVPGMIVPLPGVVYTTAPVAYPPPYPGAAYTITAVGGGGGGGAPGRGGGGGAPPPQGNWSSRQGPPPAQASRGGAAPSARSQPMQYASQQPAMVGAASAPPNGNYQPQQYSPTVTAGNPGVAYTTQGYGGMPMGSAPPQQLMAQQPPQSAQAPPQLQQQGYAQVPMPAGGWVAPAQGGMMYVSGAPAQMVTMPAMVPQGAYAQGMQQQQPPQQQPQMQGSLPAGQQPPGMMVPAGAGQYMMMPAQAMGYPAGGWYSTGDAQGGAGGGMVMTGAGQYMAQGYPAQYAGGYQMAAPATQMQPQVQAQGMQGMQAHGAGFGQPQQMPVQQQQMHQQGAPQGQQYSQQQMQSAPQGQQYAPHQQQGPPQGQYGQQYAQYGQSQYTQYRGPGKP